MNGMHSKNVLHQDSYGNVRDKDLKFDMAFILKRKCLQRIVMMNSKFKKMNEENNFLLVKDMNNMNLDVGMKFDIVVA